jgi:hypothetical protein
MFFSYTSYTIVPLDLFSIGHAAAPHESAFGELICEITSTTDP